MATDPAKLALNPQRTSELVPLQKAMQLREKARPRVKFVTLPYEQTLEAAAQLRNAQLAVLIELAHLRFKRHQNPVPLANTALRTTIRRDAKLRALHALEEAGLVKVTWRGRKCPLVLLLWR